MSRRLMRNVISGLVLATCSFSTLAGNKWNGAGKVVAQLSQCRLKLGGNRLRWHL